MDRYKTRRDEIQQLWLIYTQLKNAEDDPDRRPELLERSREELGHLLNDMYKSAQLSCLCCPKSPGNQAANLNCRDRQFNLTPDTRHISTRADCHTHVCFHQRRCIVDAITNHCCFSPGLIQLPDI